MTQVPEWPTLVYTKPSPYTTARAQKVKKTETFQETAKYLLNHDGKRNFTATDIVELCRAQGYVARLSEVCDYLHYDEGYIPDGLPQRRTYWRLERREGESYHWELYEFDPEKPENFQTRIVYSGSRSEKLARIEAIKAALLTKLTAPEERALLWEAMSLCTDLGLERAWYNFRAQLTRVMIPVMYNLEHENGWVDPGHMGEVYALTPAAAVTELERWRLTGTVTHVQLVTFDGQPTGWY